MFVVYYSEVIDLNSGSTMPIMRTNIMLIMHTGQRDLDVLETGTHQCMIEYLQLLITPLSIWYRGIISQDLL